MREGEGREPFKLTTVAGLRFDIFVHGELEKIHVPQTQPQLEPGGVEEAETS